MAQTFMLVLCMHKIIAQRSACLALQEHLDMAQALGGKKSQLQKLVMHKHLRHIIITSFKLVHQHKRKVYVTCGIWHICDIFILCTSIGITK
uniref:Secreted protein n=1 Tax=Ixodes ricinus TaxID=34613 RepID=A0A6B0UCY4_IXORI